MFSRNKKVKISDECMGWLRKSESSEVKAEQALMEYTERCTRIQDDVLKTITTVSNEPASADGLAEVVVEIRLAKAEKTGIMMVVTRVYAIVYAKKKYWVILDENNQPKRVSKVGEDVTINVNGGAHIEVLKTVQSKMYRISM